MEVLILTGDRDSLQLVTDDSTVLYPMRGVSDLARMTPAAVEAKYGVPPAPLPRAGGDRGGDLRQPARRAGRRPGLRREVDQPVRRPRQRDRPRRRDHRQEGRGAARPPRRRDPQPAPQRAGARPRPRLRARPTWPCSRGTGTRCTRSSTAWSSAVLRDRLLRDARVRGGDRRQRLRAARPPASATGEVAGWLAEHAPSGSGTSPHRRRRCRARWRAGTGEVWSVALAAPRRHRRLVRRQPGDARGRRRPGGLVRRRRRGQGAARREGPDAGAAPPGAGRCAG